MRLTLKIPTVPGMDKKYWFTLGGCSLLLVSALLLVRLHNINAKPQPMAHTLEYNNVVDEHIDTAKVPRAEIDLAVAKQEVGQRFAIYQFSHPKLRGSWGDLNVLVDRQTGKSVSRSLFPVGKARPNFTLSSLPECLMAEQPKQSYEICVR
jgi:hypothetical protein